MVNKAADLQEIFKGAFFPGQEKPVQAPEPDPIEDTEKPGKIRPERSVKDPFAAAEAQRIFNPNMPPVTRRPLKDQLDMGTGPAMDTSGRWGTSK